MLDKTAENRAWSGGKPLIGGRKVPPRAVVGLMIFVLGWLVCFFGSALAEDSKDTSSTESTTDTAPLYEQDPYDLITLDKQNGGKVLKVEPLDLPGRRLPRYIRPGARLRIHLWDNPEKLYEVRWSNIAKIEFFEQLVMAKALELAKQGDNEKAYDYFQWLTAKDPEMPGLKESLGDYLLGEARRQRDAGQYHGALAMLATLHDYYPQHSQLEKAFGQVEDTLFQKYDASGDYSSLRILLRNFRTRFPDSPVGIQWETDLKKRAGDQLARANKAVSVGDFREANRAVQEVLRIWPDLPGSREMVELLHRRYPRVVVGVTSLAVSSDPRRRQDWAARRTSRLIYRTLTEFLGPGAEGGDYLCPFGTIEIEPLQCQLMITLRENIHWASGNATLTSADVARQLLDMAEPGNDQYQAAWSELFADARTSGVYRVEVGMRRPHVRPDALLQIPLAPHGGIRSMSAEAPSNGPYVLESSKKNTATYVANRRYFAAQPAQPKEIVERYFDDDQTAIRALRDGRIHVLDRINPWALDEFRSMKNVVVESYKAPLVHCLIPNRKKPLMDEVVFRRALVYGIHREAILNEILGGKPVDGCYVVSGPFPRGEDFDDPIGYAYDSKIQPCPYEAGMAILLANVGVDVVAAAKARREAEARGKPEETTAQAQPASTETKPPANAKKPDPKKNKKDKIIAKLVLAHPNDAVARLACQNIEKQLLAAGIKVTLKELPPGYVGPVPDDADLLYAELPMWEPVVDACALLGVDGPSHGASDYMNRALRQLRQAADWQQVRPLLREIHRIAHDDVSVIPLWQLVDHYARRADLRNVGDRPVSLYENIEQWRLTTNDPTGQPPR